MNKIIITIIIFLAGFISFGFAADYTMNCVDGTATGTDQNSYDCSSCNGTPYYQTYLNGGIQFSKKCCEGGIYTNSNNEVDCCDKGTALTGGVCVSCEILTSIPAGWQANCDAQSAGCNEANLYTGSNGVQLCCPGMLQDGICIENNEGNMGINMSSECLINGQCSYNIYQTLGIRKSDQNPSVSTFVKDIVLAVTMFIGTVVSIVLIISGILYIVSSIQGNSTSADMAKKGIINSIVGLLLVVSSYAIVRLIQFLATAGGG